MTTTRYTVLCSIIAGLTGCAVSAGRPASEPGPIDVTGVTAVKDTVAARGGTTAEHAEFEKVEVALAVTDTEGRVASLRACPFLARSPGDFTGGRFANIVTPGCVYADEDGVARLPLDAQSELIVTAYADGHPGYTAQLTTGQRALDLSRAPLPLLTQAQIDAAYAAAGSEIDPERTTVLVATTVQDAGYELLLDTHAQGPAPIYLDEDGRVVPGASSAANGGFALFANVPTGMHAIAFGHPTREMERAPGLGWAGPDGGTTTVWTFPGHVHVVAGIEAVGVDG